jgi:hypothetical protein
MRKLVLRREEVFAAQRKARDGALQDEQVVYRRAPDLVPFIPQNPFFRTSPERESKPHSVQSPERRARTTAAIATTSSFARALMFLPFRLPMP